MTNRAEIERLLNQTGRTLEGLPKNHSQIDKLNYIAKMEIGESISEHILHQSDVIELLVGALRDALEDGKDEISDAQFEEFSKKAREAARR